MTALTRRSKAGLKLFAAMTPALALALLTAPAPATSAQPPARTTTPTKIAVGKRPQGVVAVGSTAYVTNAPLRGKMPGQLVYVNLRRDRVFARVTVGKDPLSLAIDAAKGLAYVSNFIPGTVSVINLRQRKVVDTLQAGFGPTNVALVGPKRHRMLVVLNQGYLKPPRGSIDIWDLRTMKRVRRLNVNYNPSGLASLGHERVLVGSENTGHAYVLNVKKRRFVRRLTLPVLAVHEIAAGSKFIYVTAEASNSIGGGTVVLSRHGLKQVGRVVKALAPGDPLFVAVSSDNRAYVVNNGFGEPVVSTLQVLRGPHTIGSRKLGKCTIGIALAQRERTLLATVFDEGKLWVFPRPLR